MDMGFDKTTAQTKQLATATFAAGLVWALLVMGCSSGELGSSVSTTSLPFDPADYPPTPLEAAITVAGDESLDDKLAGVADVSKVTELNFVGTTLEELPARVGELTGVTHMIIENNASLKALPAELGNLSLLYLVVQDNPSLERVPEEICQLDKLALFSLSSSSALEQLPSCMARMDNLKNVYVLDAGNNTGVWMPLGGLANEDLFFLFEVRGPRSTADLATVASQLPKSSWLSLAGCDCPENDKGQILLPATVCEARVRIIPAEDSWELNRDLSSWRYNFRVDTSPSEDHWTCSQDTA